MKSYIIAGLLLLIILMLEIVFVEKIEFFALEKNGICSFDKYLYINLKHRKDRKKQILDQLNKMDIPKNKINRINAVHEKYNGHIGCAKSHIKALEKAQKENLDNVVIFEDDFIFTLDKEKVDEKINKFLEDYKDNWDVLQLTSHYVDLEDLNKDYVKKVKSATTSSAYIIQKSFFNTLKNNIINAKDKMEEEMKDYNKTNKGKKKFETGYALDQHWNDLQKKSRWYIFDPYIGKQEGGSSIMSGDLEGFSMHSRFYKLTV